MTRKRKINLFNDYILPFSGMALLGLGAGGAIAHMKDISRPIRFSLDNGNNVLADGNSYTVTNSTGKPIQHFNNAGIALEYTDSTKKQHRINERGHTDIDSVSGEYGEFVSFTEDSTMYWVKKEFEDIQRMEVRERAKRKNLEGGL
ncbi:hypothetical protein A3K62_01745 [Candidatus Pacearchaeota archaeon RBG_16_35_8]|nr:MAG: hypothetical protein A3K62_01745 [Candidatus Pacearchaeota archaeon RBG_16_35_8]